MLLHSELSFAQGKGLTLHEALASAYQKNPDLDAVRAELKSIDENYVQALAGFKPTVAGVADYSSSHTTRTSGDPKSVALEVSQSLYSGGGTLAGVDLASNQIKAERAKLRVTEQQVLLDSVTTYMTVLRDQQIVELNQNNEKVLESHYKAAQARFKLGDITKTDVSQAQSRYAKATADRISAEGTLKQSRAAFEKVIGLIPQRLEKPAPNPAFPASEEDAIAAALQNNPSIIYAKYTQAAASSSTRAFEAENLPDIDLTGSIGRTYDPVTSGLSHDNARTIGIRATLPLYTGGSTQSRIRQSRHLENQYRLQARSAENTVRQSVIAAREGLAAAEAVSRSLQTQIEAEKLALEGVQVEANYGSRTTLDLLDAEQEYLNAQVAYVSAEADRIIATYSLIAALGRLTAEGLKLNVPVYNMAENFQNLKKGTLGGSLPGDK